MKRIIYMLIAMTIISCNKTNVREWDDNQISEWYRSSKWMTLPSKPDLNTDKRMFVEQNILNPKSWNAVFEFLKTTDLNSLALGRIDLLNDGTYLNVQEYETKDTAEFEAHRQYIDIQCLSKGREYIYITSIDGIKITKPYVEAKDIFFFTKDEYTKHLLSTDNFIVLFPQNGHMPCMKVDDNESVRKVVFKIPYIP